MHNRRAAGHLTTCMNFSGVKSQVSLEFVKALGHAVHSLLTFPPGVKISRSLLGERYNRGILILGSMQVAFR